MALVGLGHVGGIGGVAAAAVGAAMGADALAAMEDLDRAHAGAHVDGLVHEGVGDGVVVAVELDVVIDVDPGRLPLAVDEGLRRLSRSRTLFGISGTCLVRNVSQVCEGGVRRNARFSRVPI
jgi:hypothetical protein